MHGSEWGSESPEAFKAPRVLIADDDEATRILLRTALTQWGYAVVEATNGEEAWEILQQPDAPQILTLDWLMPKLDGLSLCKRIDKELPLRPYIIFLTRMTGAESVMQGLEAGADEFILKPFDLTELRIRVFAGERIVKYRHQIEEQKKQLQQYIANMEARAKEHAKQLLPFDDLVTLLQEVSDVVKQADNQQLLNKSQQFINKLKDFLVDTKTTKNFVTHKPKAKTISAAPPEKIKQEGETMLNMERMRAFFGDNKSAIKDFITTFIDLANEQINEIENAIKNKDAKSAKYFFHLLGSASGNSGMMKMYEICGKGEENVNTLDWKAVEESYQALRRCVHKLQIDKDNLL